VTRTIGIINYKLTTIVAWVDPSIN